MQSRLRLRKHAHERSFQRSISRDDIRHVLETGEIIQEYPDDRPLPSYLVLGWTENESRPIHVVAADDEEEDVTHVITVYEPDPDLWTDDFRKKQSD